VSPAQVWAKAAGLVAPVSLWRTRFFRLLKPNRAKDAAAPVRVRHRGPTRPQRSHRAVGFRRFSA